MRYHNTMRPAQAGRRRDDGIPPESAPLPRPPVIKEILMVEWVDALIPQPPQVTPDAIRAAEEQLDVRFPSDFLDVVRVHQGAQPVPNHITIPDFGGTAVAHLLHFQDAPGHTNIVARRFPLDDAMEDGVIPFAEDVGDDLFCFDYRRNPARPSVVFWSVDTGPLHLADSFTDFLDILYEDE